MGWCLQGPCCSLHFAQTADICDSWSHFPRTGAGGGARACSPHQPPEPGGAHRSWSLSWRSSAATAAGSRSSGSERSRAHRAAMASLSEEASSRSSSSRSHSSCPTRPCGHTGWDGLCCLTALRGRGQSWQPPGPRLPPADLTNPRAGSCSLEEGHRISRVEGSLSCVHKPSLTALPPSPVSKPWLPTSPAPRPETSLALLECCLAPLLLHSGVVGPAPDRWAVRVCPSDLLTPACGLANVLRGRWGRGTLLNPQFREWTQASSPRRGNERGVSRGCLSHTMPSTGAEGPMRPTGVPPESAQPQDTQGKARPPAPPGSQRRVSIVAESLSP